MTPLARALLGVALGSCLTLFIDPDSRPYMTGFLPRARLTEIVHQASGPRTGTMRRPTSVAEAGLWMQLGCERLATGGTLSRDELKSLVSLAQYMGNWGAEPSQRENAFWPEMAAIFQDQLGDQKGARKSWELASKGIWWKDYQSARLLETADQMRMPDGPMAWHLAALYYQRQFAVGPVLLEYARKALATTGQTKPEDIQFRFESLYNAHLIAEGAQSITVLNYAAAIADLTYQTPTGLPIAEKGKDKDKARGLFTQALVDIGHVDEANMASSYLNEIDTRPVLAMAGHPKETSAGWSAFSILTSNLPGALVILALLGGVLWPLGLVISRYANDHRNFAWPPALLFGGVLGVGVFSLTFLPLAAMVALLSSLFLVFTPKNERSKFPSDLGPVFTWTVGFLGILFICVALGFISGLSTQGQILLPSILHASPAIVQKKFVLVLGGLAAILFALLLLLSPMWAFARRIRTPFVLGLAVQTFAKTLVLVGLAGVIVLGPLCIYADSRARGTLFELVGNEPEHYYNIFR